MPLLTRWFIKSSLIFFIAALLVGIGLAAGSTFHLPGWISSLGPVYFHMFMVGWVTQFIYYVIRLPLDLNDVNSSDLPER